MADAENVEPPTKEITSTDRIKQLNAIDADISRLLRTASDSIQILTSNSATDSNLASSASLSERQASFKKSSNTYISLLSSIHTRLRRQVLALRSAGIVPAGTISKDSSAGAGSGGEKPDQGERSAQEMGLGSLDIGWLNSRNDSVGNEMEAELWAKAKEFLEQLEGGEEDGVAGEEVSSGEQRSGDVSMQEE